MAYEESIAKINALIVGMPQGKTTFDIFDLHSLATTLRAVKADLEFAQEQNRLFNIAAQDARKSLAQEIAETLRVRGYWVPEDIISADLISAVGQAVSLLRNLAEKATGNEIPIGTKPNVLVDAIAHVLAEGNDAEKELARRNDVVVTEGMVEFISRALKCSTHITEGYEGNPDIAALVKLGVFEVIGNDMYHLRNAGYGQ